VYILLKVVSMRTFFFVVFCLLNITGVAENLSYEAYSKFKQTIVIDAGHGGTDQGAKAKSPYCEEKRITLQTAKLIKKYLDQLGYKVIMTRENDAFISLARRIEIAKQSDAAIFVSIHFNSSPSTLASGMEIFFYDSTTEKKRSLLSKHLADLVLNRVILRTQAHSRGVKKGNLYVLRESPIPAILFEGGFISNLEERIHLKQFDYQEKIARGIADGIDFYFKKKKK